jgi:hypothetical protein
MSNSNNTTCNVTAEILLANISGDVVGYGVLLPPLLDVDA